MKTISMMAFVVIAFSVILASCSKSSSNTPSDMAVAYIESAADGNTDEVLEMLYTNKEVTQEDRAMLQFFVGAFAAKVLKNKGIDKIEVDNESMKEDRGAVTLSILFNNGREDRQRVKFRKVEGDWKIKL